MIRSWLMTRSSRWMVVTIGLAAILALVALAGCGLGQAAPPKYPTKAITAICPWSPGGSTDLIARAVAAKLSEKWGVPVNIVNKAGGNGIPGTLEALGAAADGYTILVESNATSSLLSAWGKDVPFDIAERTYLTRAGDLAFVVFARADAPWKNLDDLAEAIKKDPANIKWGWLGGTGGTDVVGAQYLAAIKDKGIDISKIKMVTYPGGADVATAVAGGHNDAGVSSPASIGPVYAAGKVKVLGIAGGQRFKGYPEVASAAEQGWKSIDNRYWVGFSGPKGLPASVVQTWTDTVKTIVNDPAMRAEWDKLGADPAFLGGEDFKKFVLDEAKSIKSLPVGGGK